MGSWHVAGPGDGSSDRCQPRTCTRVAGQTIGGLEEGGADDKRRHNSRRGMQAALSGWQGGARGIRLGCLGQAIKEYQCSSVITRAETSFAIRASAVGYTRKQGSSSWPTSVSLIHATHFLARQLPSLPVLCHNTGEALVGRKEGCCDGDAGSALHRLRVSLGRAGSRVEGGRVICVLLNVLDRLQRSRQRERLASVTIVSAQSRPRGTHNGIDGVQPGEILRHIAKVGRAGAGRGDEMDVRLCRTLASTRTLTRAGCAERQCPLYQSCTLRRCCRGADCRVCRRRKPGRPQSQPCTPWL